LQGIPKTSRRTMRRPEVSAMSDMPYHVLDSGKVRCHVCGALLRWVDAIETEIGYACEDHILQEDDEPAGGDRR
jgi:hypothetical protein